MATHRVPILGWPTIPDTGGDVFFEPYPVKATNDQWGRLVCVFNGSTSRIGLRGGFPVPKNYVGAPKLVVEWSATGSTGNVVWDFDYRAVGGNDTESFDATGVQESVTVTDAVPGAANRKLEATVNLTAGNFSADDEVLFELFRDGAATGDSYGGAALLFNALFEYTDA